MPCANPSGHLGAPHLRFICTSNGGAMLEPCYGISARGAQHRRELGLTTSPIPAASIFP